MKNYIGIDLGGTNVRVAKINEEGEILSDLIRPSYGMEGPEKIVGNIVDMLKQFDLSDCISIGIGIPGPVDTVKNRITMATNIPGMEFYPVADIIEKETGLKVYLDNDANVAGLAEAVLGAGKGKRTVYFFTHSTGIGGALIHNGKLISGRNGYAGEIANIIVKDNGKKINHLNPGAVENEASGTAICRIGKEIIGEEIKDARDVFALARNNDERALKIVDQMAYDIAKMMSVISHVCDPDCYVIGGGVSKASDLYFDKLGTYLNSLVHVGMRDVPILKAVLKEPGVVGAAMLARSHDND